MTTTLTESDLPRLEKQLPLVGAYMSDHQWHTLEAGSRATGIPEASFSARLRDLRAAGNRVERKRVNGPMRGLHAYRLAPLGALTAAMVDKMLPPEKPMQTVERWI